MYPASATRATSTFIGLVLLALISGCSDDAAPASYTTHARQRAHAEAKRALGKFLETRGDGGPQFDPLPAGSKADRFVIIHADDAGMCRSVNRGTIDALEAGLVTSASIMVPCPAFEEFADYARAHPEFDYGVHLTLNAEFRDYRWGPVSPPDDVPSLIDGDGFLWRTEQEVAAHARVDEVERELRAQIDRALDLQVPLSHLDSHMGTLFARPDFVEMYLRLGADYDLPILVSRDDGFVRQLGVDERVIEQLPDIENALIELGFPVLDDIQMHYSGSSAASKKQVYGQMITGAKRGVTEIIIHCGYDDAELQSVTLRAGIRDGDRQVFTDSAFVDEMRLADVTLISWKQLMQVTSRAAVSD